MTPVLCLLLFIVSNLRGTKSLGHLSWWLKYGYPFLEFLHKYISSRGKTEQPVYTDILVTKFAKISAGRALLFLSVFVYFFAVDNLTIYSPTKFLKRWNYLQFRRILCTYISHFLIKKLLLAFSFVNNIDQKRLTLRFSPLHLL